MLALVLLQSHFTLLFPIQCCISSSSSPTQKQSRERLCCFLLLCSIQNPSPGTVKQCDSQKLCDSSMATFSFPHLKFVATQVGSSRNSPLGAAPETKDSLAAPLDESRAAKAGRDPMPAPAPSMAQFMLFP